VDKAIPVCTVQVQEIRKLNTKRRILRDKVLGQYEQEKILISASEHNLIELVLIIMHRFFLVYLNSESTQLNITSNCQLTEGNKLGKFGKPLE